METKNEVYEKAIKRVSESPELSHAFDRARIKTNLLYTLLMVASDFAVDVNDDLKSIEFKLMSECPKQIKKALKHEAVVKDVLMRMCRVLWVGIDATQQAALFEDVTRIKKLLITVLEKSGKDDSRFDSILKMISTRYNNKLELGDDKQYIE